MQVVAHTTEFEQEVADALATHSDPPKAGDPTPPNQMNAPPAQPNQTGECMEFAMFGHGHGARLMEWVAQQAERGAQSPELSKAGSPGMGEAGNVRHIWGVTNWSHVPTTMWCTVNWLLSRWRSSIETKVSELPEARGTGKRFGSPTGRQVGGDYRL